MFSLLQIRTQATRLEILFLLVTSIINADSNFAHAHKSVSYSNFFANTKILEALRSVAPLISMVKLMFTGLVDYTVNIMDGMDVTRSRKPVRCVSS